MAQNETGEGFLHPHRQVQWWLVCTMPCLEGARAYLRSGDQLIRTLKGRLAWSLIDLDQLADNRMQRGASDRFHKDA